MVAPPPGLDFGELYQPHALQRLVHNSPAKVKIMEVGRRGGKSREAFFEMVDCYIEALGLDDRDRVPVPHTVIPPFHAWIVAPSYPQARQVWNELISFLPPQFIAPGGIKQDERLIFLRGSPSRTWGQIEVKSAHDPETLQTAGLDFLWITEAQDVKDLAYFKLLPTLRSPDRISRAVFEGIPSTHSDHWFRKSFVAAQSRDGWEAFHWTAFDNPLLTDFDRAEIEADREMLPEAVWNRMYMADFSEETGYFKNITACIEGDLLPGPIPGNEYVAGIDLGRKVDATVFTVLDAKDRRVVHHSSWEDGANWVMQREAITAQANMWGLSRIVIDATGIGDVFMQELQESGLSVEPFIISSASREALLQSLAVAMERETVHFPPVPQLLRQIRAFQYRKMPSGNYRVEAPRGEHDDEVFALALGLTACAESPPIGIRQPHSMRRVRYVPTQSEVDNNSWSESRGAMIMRERRIQRMRDRAEAAGIEI